MPLAEVLVDKSASVSPAESPQHSQATLLQVPPTHSAPPIAIRITSSSSSFSLAEAAPPEQSEMRRCASTSGLILAAATPEDDEEDVVSALSLPPPCTLTLLEDCTKGVSAENLSVTYRVDSRYDSNTATPVNEVGQGGAADDDTLSQEDGIVINVIGGSSSSSHSLSSSNAGGGGATQPEVDEFDDDISGYREQEIDALMLPLPHEDEPSEDEDSLTDCGIQFKVTSAQSSDAEEEEDDDYAFVASVLDSGVPCQEEDIECPVNVLRISVAYSEDLPEDTSVRLQVHPEASAREILEAVVGQVNESGRAYVDEQTLDELSLVVSFGSSSERHLSDSFQPLKVQNPWTKGKLFAKRRTDVPSSG